ncbi:CBM35 domain-containing protein [Streptacidiphilus anmyonensis]|uniref:CBM35 domain-containing protein n=1 Tax=Streptacidiphilus anmyonensis TaxID=405782 RepID=UPI0005A98478|nr:CBM35 domain-containing protein [Streptacidiphilus anmyonensis]
MTAENNGVPEDDDPFAYLYRAENGEEGGAAPTQPMPGVPRTSYQQATQVGRVQYGQSGYSGQQQSAYGQQQPGYGQQQGYGQQAPGYSGVPHQAQPPAGGGRAATRASGGSGGSSRGVMIGAVAVVAAVAIGIGMALFNGGGKGDNASGSTTSASAAATGSSSASASASASGTLPGATDAATMTLQGTAAVTTPAGAKAAGGSSVPITNGQQSVTWTVNVPTAGQYYVWIRYNNPGANATDVLLVNGQKSRDADFQNYTPGAKDPSQTWFRTYNQPNLPAGQVKITIQGVDGQPPVNIDQLAITAQHVSPWS